MKIKNLLLALSLAGGSVGLPAFAGDAVAQPSTRSIGDLAARQPAENQQIGSPVKSIGDANLVSTPIARGRLISDSQLVAPAASACDKGTSCDRSGPSGWVSCATPSSTNVWFGAETLLWFGQRQSSPALITTAPMTTLPILGNPGVSVQFGGQEGIDYGLIPGYRLSAGMYLDECQKIGLGGRVYGIFPDKDSYAIANGTGDPSIGVPFFNADPNVMADSAQLIAYHDGNQLAWAGDARVRADLDMVGTDGSLHLLLARSRDHRVDLLAGYTFNRLQSSIDLRTTRTNFDTGDLIPDGTIFRTVDLFETDNQFHGAHLGVLSSVVRNRLTLSTLAKVSFGNMRQTGAINGFSEQELGGSVTPTVGGIFAQASNIGTFARDRFAFIPELGIKAGYSIAPGIELTTGYTFMYWSSVALAGEQMDSVVDPTQTVSRPVRTNAIGSYWMQGLDLGMQISY
ncbi:MAG: hypothetical protein KatS3mg111_3866 [Pirellulaceae bacterium]|nr:MAG: hypothetical protein KatS3mg111_3866 [Pirellulaceae bacterium]